MSPAGVFGGGTQLSSWRRAARSLVAKKELADEKLRKIELQAKELKASIKKNSEAETKAINEILEKHQKEIVATKAAYARNDEGLKAKWKSRRRKGIREATG